MQAPHEQLIQPLPPRALSIAYAGGFIDVVHIKLAGVTEHAVAQHYSISVVDSIARILNTRLGARIMRPDFGSDLYRLRDRAFDAPWKVLATRYIFEAIEHHEPRVRLDRLHFQSDGLAGITNIAIDLSPRGA